jgi:hypothetical protein
MRLSIVLGFQRGAFLKELARLPKDIMYYEAIMNSERES